MFGVRKKEMSEIRRREKDKRLTRHYQAKRQIPIFVEGKLNQV